MANNFDLSALALQMACPGNVQILDDKGLPGAYVARPAMKLSDLLDTDNNSVHPAFFINGVQKDTLYFGKYQACVNLNRAYSLPGVDPAIAVFDAAMQYCRNKGDGHHLITAAEWAYLALLAKKRGTMPKGNNNLGKDSTESLYLAIPTYKNEDTGQTQRTATGTGPLTWSDTHDATGIMDLNGNVWEWCAGLRLVRGELQVIPYNNAADPDVDMSATSAAWKAIKATATSFDNLFITPNGAGTTSGSVKLDYNTETNQWRWQSTAITSADDSVRAGSFADTTAVGLSAFCKLYLQAMALLPEDDAQAGDYGSDGFWGINYDEEIILIRGGAWDQRTSCGVFALSFQSARLRLSHILGFRAAYL